MRHGHTPLGHWRGTFHVQPLVLDIIQRLERLGDLLAKIQKALGKYLEREGFYFVGNENLLKIIGNSKAIGKLQKHFKKMFRVSTG